MIRRLPSETSLVCRVMDSEDSPGRLGRHGNVERLCHRIRIVASQEDFSLNVDLTVSTYIMWFLAVFKGCVKDMVVDGM